MEFRSNIVFGCAKWRQNFGSKKGVKLSQQLSRGHVTHRNVLYTYIKKGQE